MRKLGLGRRFSALELGILLAGGACLTGCKAAPETAPPGASAPVATTAPAAQAPPPAASAGPPGAAGTTRVYAESSASIQASVGEKFSVALPANITVPMKWRLEPPPDAKLLALGGERYVDQPPADCSGCTGYGGTRIFDFAATGSGNVKLHFALRPLSDPQGTAQKEVSIDVTVK